jgi:hypothetical protein
MASIFRISRAGNGAVADVVVIEQILAHTTAEDDSSGSHNEGCSDLRSGRA